MATNEHSVPPIRPERVTNCRRRTADFYFGIDPGRFASQQRRPIEWFRIWFPREARDEIESRNTLFSKFDRVLRKRKE